MLLDKNQVKWYCERLQNILRLSEFCFAGMIQIEQIRPEKPRVKLKDRETTKM